MVVAVDQNPLDTRAHNLISPNRHQATDSNLFDLLSTADFLGHMPNFGDIALHTGMAALLAESHQGDIIRGTWNSFPWMTWSRLDSEGATASERFASWHDQVASGADNPSSWQRLTAHLLPPAGLLINRRARRQTGQSGWQALFPRLCPHLAARQFMQRLARSDAAYMNAGGLLSDHLSHYLPARIFAIDSALRAGKPTAIVNYSFGISRPELLAWVAPVLRRVTVHAVRESESRKRLLAIGVPAERILVSPDSAFAATPPVIAKREPAGIAIQIRGDIVQDEVAWGELIPALRTRFNTHVQYLIGCRNHDPPLARAMTPIWGDVEVVHPQDLDSLRSAIGHARVLITDRYHGCVFATQMGTPFVPIAGTTHKTAGLIADLGYPLPLHDRLSPRGVGAILDDVSHCISRRDELVQLLKTRAGKMHSELCNDYREILNRLFENGTGMTEQRETE